MSDERHVRILSDQAQRFLQQALPKLEAITTTEARVATELLMDTGRRLNDVLQLPLDCLSRGEDGSLALLYGLTRTANATGGFRLPQRQLP